MKLARWLAISAVVIGCLGGRPSAAVGQAELRELKLPPRPAPVMPTRYRLLPADNELQEGDAAVILLRMIWEQRVFVNEVLPKVPDLMGLDYDDPRLRAEFSFDSFYRQLRRAAYRRNANWNYPIGEEPLAMILLPDLQGGREFSGRGLALWIRQRIADGECDLAREGILVGLANARHYARTPFLVNQLVAVAIADQMLDELELLMAQPDAPNFYWSLTMLPDSMFSMRAALQWESRMLVDSIPGLDDAPPRSEDVETWRQLATELVDLLAKIGNSGRPTPAEAERRLRQFIENARKELPQLTGEDPMTVEDMSDEEVGVRWYMWHHNQINSRMEAAASLAHPHALQRLQVLQTELVELKERSGLPVLGLMENPLTIYASLHRVDRRIARLRSIEAIRDYAARHDGQLPDSLEDITDLDVPVDPLTGQPFGYTPGDGSFALTVPMSETIREVQNVNLEYRVELIDR